MADGIVNIDSGKAHDWSKRVNEEVARTNITLKEVTDVCNEFPGEDDCIMQAIEATGSVLTKAYEETSKAFKNAWEEISRGISEFSKVGEKISGSFDDLMGKLGR